MLINESKFSLRKDNTNKLKYFLLCKIDQLGEFQFQDDSWYYRKKHINSLPKGTFTITFYQIPIKYREWVKYYALLCDLSPCTIHKKCLGIAFFLKFIEEYYPLTELHQITCLQVNAFEFHLMQLNISEAKKQHTYASVQDFFMKLTDFPDFPNVTPVKQINPFKQIRFMKSDMLLPKRVITTWDKAFKNEDLDIPLELRVVYWLIRSFPNRITEILSMKIDSLKSFYSQYVIQIPTFKQNGGHPEAVLKPIPVVYAGHGKYVIDLIRSLQNQTKEYLSSSFNSDNNKQDLLFCVRYWNFDKRKKSPSICINPKRTNILQNWTGSKVNELFSQLAVVLDIRDDDGNVVFPKTHQFRHHAVTDRLYTVGYTMDQIRKLTGHKNMAMQKFYTHQVIEKHKEIHLGIQGLSTPEDSSYEFRGKIVNLDERTVSHLSKDKKKYLTWEANGKKGVGICSDITGCNPKGTTVHFECYACNWFVPKVEFYEDYKTEHSFWKNVVDQTSQNTTRAAHFENAVRNMSYLERIIKICELGVEQHKQDTLEEQINVSPIHELNWE